MATAAKTRPTMDAPNTQTQMVPVDAIVPPDINREEYGNLEELADSIRAQGLLQAITVAPREDGKFDLIIGERRWKATKLAGFNAIEAKVVELDPVERMEQQLSENIHRKELTTIERARQVDKYFAVAAAHGQKMTQEEAAKRLGLNNQSQVSKYRTLYRLYQGVESFKSAYEAGRVTLTEAVELGRLTKAPEKDAALITRVLHEGIDKGNIAQAVKQELDRRVRNKKRAAKQQELKLANATIAPDDFHKHGGRRLGPGSHELNVDPTEHAGLECHAVYVTSTLDVQPVCMDPDSHKDVKPTVPAKSDKKSKAAGEKPEKVKGESGPDATPENTPTEETAADARTEAGEREAGTSAGDEPVADSSDEDEERKAEEAAKAAHQEALREAGMNRRAALRAWLTGKPRLTRGISDTYVFRQVVNIALDDDDVDQRILRELLDIPEESDVLDAIREMAEKNEEHLRRVAVALLCERVEAGLEHDSDYQNAMAGQHYELLHDAFGYLPSDEERLELGIANTESDAS